MSKLNFGYVNTECCQSLVKATIPKGMVTEVRVEPCKSQDRVKLQPDMKRLVDTALKRVAKGNPRPPKFPMTISAMMENLGGITVITCVQIGFLGWCISCCQQPSGDVICGRLTIDPTYGPYPEEQ